MVLCSLTISVWLLRSEPNMPAICYLERIIQGCKNDELTVIMRWNGARMMINIDRNLSSQVVENSLIDDYSSACLQDDEDAEDAVQDHLLDNIKKTGQTILDELASPSTPEPSDLHSVLRPPQFSFNLVTVGGEFKLLLEGSHRLEISNVPGQGYESAVPIPGFQLQNTDPPSFHFQLQVNQGLSFPKHQTTDVQIIEKLLGDGYISHVSVNGQEMCATVGKDFDGGSLQREFNCLSQISALAIQQDLNINVPKLLGLIETPGNGKIVGILEELIPPQESHELASLGAIEDVSAIPRQRRAAWASQIRRTVDLLHADGIVWGDGKPDNILIHPVTDEPWLIDFGGGTTPGWVDQHLAGTVEGDNQAVKRIFEFLEIECDGKKTDI